MTGNLLSTLAPGYGVLFAARIVTALVTSTFFANAIVIATASAPPDKKASTVAKLAFGMNLAMILGAPLGTWIGETFGWRTTFAAITACCATGLLLVARFVPNDQPGVRARALHEFTVFRDRDLLLAITITAVADIDVLMVFTYLAPLLTSASFPAGAAAPMLLVLGGHVITGPGLPTVYLAAAATTVLGLGLSGLTLRRRAPRWQAHPPQTTRLSAGTPEARTGSA